MSNFNAVLIVQVCDTVKEGEIERVSSIARRHGAILQHIPLNSNRVADLYATCSEGMFDLVYICGHGNEFGVGTQDNEFTITFPQLAAVLCGNLTATATVLLSCCDGGTESIASDLMAFCDKMNSVVGVPAPSPGDQLDTAFNVLLYQLAHGSDATEAATRASEAAIVPASSFADDHTFQFRVFVRERPDQAIQTGVASISTDQLQQAGSIALGRYSGFDNHFVTSDETDTGRREIYLTGDGRFVDAFGHDAW